MGWGKEKERGMEGEARCRVRDKKKKGETGRGGRESTEVEGKNEGREGWDGERRD